MLDQPLDREQVVAVIEGRSAARRVPLVYHMWINPGPAGPRHDAVEDILRRYPQDVQLVPVAMPPIYDAPEADPSYRWVPYSRPEGAGDPAGALDAQIAVPDWSLLDDILAEFPSPSSPAVLPERPEPDGRYRLGHWWFCLFERHWSLRGMQNALMDFYLAPDEVKRLYRALTDFYLQAMERAHSEVGLDGIFTSDDLGAQTGPMFSAAVFEEFFKPLYAELIERAHTLGMNFWLHACGNIEPFIPHLAEIGLDVLHPLQKYTMDERRIAERYGGRMCFWVGFDVQQVIPWGTPDEVRREVRFLVDTFQRPEGRLILGAGNAVHEDCTLASLEALLDESLRAPAKKR